VRKVPWSSLYRSVLREQYFDSYIAAMASQAYFAVSVSMTCSSSVVVSRVCIICDLALASLMLKIVSSLGSDGGVAEPSTCFHRPRVFRASVMRNFQCLWLLAGPLSFGIDPMNIDVAVLVDGILGGGLVVVIGLGMMSYVLVSESGLGLITC